MSDLQYLLIFKSSGIPVYSRCFSNFCSILMKDDVLLSGFLSALTIIGSSDQGFNSINFEGTNISLEFSESGELASIDMDGTKLIFFLSKNNEYYIAAGFPEDEFELTKDSLDIDTLFSKVQLVLELYEETNWNKVSNKEYDLFEQVLLKRAVYPWMKTQEGIHTCLMGESCALKMAMTDLYSSKTSIWDRILETIKAYRSKNMFSKMKMMMGGFKHKLTGQ